MKTLLYAILLLVSGSSFALNHYEKASTKWIKYFNINKYTEVKSKVKLSYYNEIMIAHIYHYTVNEFFKEYCFGDNGCCSLGKLNINIIPQRELDNKIYFPKEGVYSNNRFIVFGRYFRYNNTMYIVSPNYYHGWGKFFAHELLHYLYDTCDIYFVNNNDEHIELEEMLKIMKF